MPAKRRITGEMRERLVSMAGAAAEVQRNPSIWGDNRGCWLTAIGFLLAALAILGALYATGVIDYDFTRTSEERDASPPDNAPAASPEAQAPGGSSAENPTAIGQAVDALVRPAIEEVYGDAQLQSAPSVEAPIVSLQYGIPRNPVQGDGEKLRDALTRREARVDPANSEMDYHAGEEFILLVDTGNPAYKSIRVSITEDLSMVYVNADRSE